MPESGVTCLSRQLPVLEQGSGTRSCGPHAVAMALSFYFDCGVSVQRVAEVMRNLRVPLLGATLPSGVVAAVRASQLRVRTGYFGTLRVLKHHIDYDRPVVVLIRPLDVARSRFYDLHYRVLVGYKEDTTLPGGGEMYFNCSSARKPLSSSHPGNVVLNYEMFHKEWLILGTFAWYCAVAS